MKLELIEYDIGKEPAEVVSVWADRDIGTLTGFCYHNFCKPRINKYGKGRVLYTICEGGIWQKWPWNWVPNDEDLTSNTWSGVLNPKFFNTACILHKDGKREIYVHSVLVNGERWDCINGWTK